MQIIQAIQNKIYEIRGERVMLDFDLAVLYESETRVLNQAVKRNIKRFPKDFMFQLTRKEWADLKSQIVMTYPQTIDFQEDKNTSSQIVMTSRPARSIPYAFTEQGVAMLSGILNSDKAIEMNIAIMRAFIAVRKIILLQTDLQEQLKLIKEKLGGHDAQLNQIYDAMENLLDEKASERKWNGRERVGFKLKGN